MLKYQIWENIECTYKLSIIKNIANPRGSKSYRLGKSLAGKRVYCGELHIGCQGVASILARNEIFISPLIARQFLRYFSVMGGII